MTEQERFALRERYSFRCGYCGVSEEDAGSLHTTDHFHPRSHGGGHEESNWVYCCRTCNEFKGNYWNPESSQRILHPLNDQTEEHIEWAADGQARALTVTGHFHIERLNLNRPALVTHRLNQRRLRAAEDRNAELLDKLFNAETRIARLSRRLSRMRRDR